MRRPSLEDLTDPEIPDGFSLRTFRAGDETGWARLMTGAIGDWDKESTERQFLGDPGVTMDSVLFLVARDEYVATATDKRLASSDIGYLHMVAVAPRYRGRRLGRSISLAALGHMTARGCSAAELDTDDHRVPAIRTYLGLGFVPEMVDADHPARWRRVLAEIASNR